jgi:hypothetical protein
MKQITFTVLATAVLLSCNNDKKTAETEKKEEPMVAAATTVKEEPMPDSATQAKNWQAYMTPGKEHEMLKEGCGSFTAEITSWMAPGAPATKSTGTEDSKMVMGGRYQQATFKGNFSGMPFEGMSLMGFDNKKKVYESTWIDNMGTGIMKMEGNWDEATKSMTMLGTFIDPATGKQMEMRQLFRIIDKDHHFAEMYCKGPDGKEFKTMEISYTRKK